VIQPGARLGAPPGTAQPQLRFDADCTKEVQQQLSGRLRGARHLDVRVQAQLGLRAPGGCRSGASRFREVSQPSRWIQVGGIILER
jgi:hypothetical protein